MAKKLRIAFNIEFELDMNVLYENPLRSSVGEKALDRCTE